MRNHISKQTIGMLFCGIVFLAAAFMIIRYGILQWQQDTTLKQQQKTLLLQKQTAAENSSNVYTKPGLPSIGATDLLKEAIDKGIRQQETLQAEPEILPEYQALYEENPDLAGWLKIDDTVIDYPVMQTPEDEDYYLSVDFYGEKNKNGCLILDTDSHTGVGTRENDYANGSAPSTNLIIHGHTMKSGQMFGNLKLYQDEEYGMAHNIICFDSLYEKREYELIAVFYSQVYYQNQNVFKYYNFFEADTQEEFDDWYNNIKNLSLYDTGVTAEFGDEFITLSCCAYHVEDGRFVVVGKRIK